MLQQQIRYETESQEISIRTRTEEEKAINFQEYCAKANANIVLSNLKFMS